MVHVDAGKIKIETVDDEEPLFPNPVKSRLQESDAPLVTLADTLYDLRKDSKELSEQVQNTEELLVQLMAERDVLQVKGTKCVATLTTTIKVKTK